MKYLLFISLLVLGSGDVLAQQDHDSVRVLENIIVNAYESNTTLIHTPAAISKVSNRDLNRYDNTSILQAINTKPGIRMDERSPGSYRLNIRGSSLRSPFGVNNVKVYYDGIPLTGPGGSTDLNMLGFYNIHTVEVIKGPAGSMYGAGTGGALLIESNPESFSSGFKAGYNMGSFNTHNITADVRLGTAEANSIINYQRMSSDGYRDHTKMNRDVISWNTYLKKNENTILRSHFIFSNLYYQTPGALTKAEYNENPRAARPHAGIFPSADEAKAAIHDQAFLAGFSLEQKISTHWKNNTSVYGYYWRHNNPTFRNYTRRVEPNLGGRTNFQYRKDFGATVFSFNTGAEFQQNFITSRLYDNINGDPGGMQTDDEINNTQGFVFAQGNVEIESGWIFTAGASLNKSAVDFKSFKTNPYSHEKRNFKNELAPRLAVLKKLNPSFSVYASLERGFSSPASSELLPTSGVFNTVLQAESGINYEVGTKGSFLGNRLFFDVTAFYYRLKNAIVQKQDAGGGIFYDNAGSTDQKGLETYVSYIVFNNDNRFFNYGFVYASNTWNDFKYDDYKQAANDYSGNKMTGVAPQTVAAGVDVGTRAGVYGHATYFFSGKIPLNDANSEFADPYHLLGLRVGYKTALSDKWNLDLFTGVQNMLDETYSLGNDINAAGGRYYNVAAGRSYFLGVIIGFDKK